MCVETFSVQFRRVTLFLFQCRTQHCVCRDHNVLITMLRRDLFQCRTQHCVCRDNTEAILADYINGVSMPHAALCVSRPLDDSMGLIWSLGFNAARSIVCVETSRPRMKPSKTRAFQCRTQHCVCRDAVSRSPCPARAEKAFWKDALFCAVFGVCG